jgi:hypothetical protein
METLRNRIFMAAVAVLGTVSLHAQTADEIVNKYVEALGGKTTVNGVKSLVVESSVEVQGQEFPSTTSILAGKGFKSETEVQGQKMVQCVTPDGGWAIGPGQSTATAVPADQAKASASQYQIGGPLVDYASKGYKVELLGKDSADYKLHLTGGSGLDITFYINMKTYLIDKQIAKANMGGAPMEVTVTFSDYRKTDNGFVFPFAQALDLPQYSLNITNKKVTVNSTVDPAIFQMPK